MRMNKFFLNSIKLREYLNFLYFALIFLILPVSLYLKSNKLGGVDSVYPNIYLIILLSKAATKTQLAVIFLL